MAKDPAFLFYPNDFDSATKFFTDAQVGIFIRLLISQFQHGRLTEKQVIFISKNFDMEIMAKFKKDKDGLYYSERLEYEINKRKKFTESRRINGKAYAKHMPTHMPKHMPKHMENENENENRNENKEGGMGGDLWMDHRRMFLEDGGWQFKFCTAKALSKYELDEYMRIFIEDIELKSDYKVKKELQRHFTNWFNLQKKKNGKRTPKNGTYQLLEELRQEHEAGLRSQAGAGS